MSFAIDPASPLGAEIRRIAGERLDAAIETLSLLTDGSETDVAASIHSVRKRCKEVRALARLAREPLGDGFDEFDNLVHDAAIELSNLHDAHAMLATLTNLRAQTAAASVRPDLAAIHEIHATLTKTVAAQLHGDDTNIEAALARLVDARARSASWKLESSDWLTNGVALVYRRGRRALARAHKHPTDDRLHEWRKQTKRLWYQMRLLEAASPIVMQPLIADLDDLGKTLGDHHDLSVLVAQLESAAEEYGGTKRVASAVKLARSQQHELVERAFRLGAGLYAERTPSFTARIMHFWMMASELGPDPVTSAV